MSISALTKLRFLIGSAAILLLAHAARADDWPQWRGPQRDGVWRETGIVEKFTSEQLPIQWRASISSGYSGPTVADGRVFITDRLTEPKQGERIHAFDEKTGQELWTYSYDCTYHDVGYVAGPRCAVLISSGRAYSLGTMGNLICFDSSTGKILWQKDLNTEYKIEMPIWGIASSPIIEGDLLIVQVGGPGACLVAFDRVSGEEKWKALDDRASYSASIVIEQAGKRVLVCWTGDRVVGLNPQSGELYWQHPFKPSRMVINVPTPVVDHDRLFVSAFYDGALMLHLDTDKLDVEKVWRRLGPDEQKTDALHCMIGTPYLEGDYVYGVDSYGQLRCLKAATGDRVWESQEAVPRARWGTIHMVRNGDRTFMFNERGQLIIAQLTPEGYHEISRTQLIKPTTDQLPQRGGVCWSHPAFANKHIFARNDHELVCASLAAEDQK